MAPKRIIGIADGKGKLVRPNHLTKQDVVKMHKAESILKNIGVKFYESLWFSPASMQQYKKWEKEKKRGAYFSIRSTSEGFPEQRKMWQFYN